MTTEYDVRIDEHGDTWVVYTTQWGTKVEVNHDAMARMLAQPIPPAILDEPWTYTKRKRGKRGKEQER